MDRMREVFQGAIALAVVVGAIGVTVMLLIQGRPLDAVPAWLTLLLGAIAGYYFGQTATAAGVTKGSNGVVEAAQTIIQLRPKPDPALAHPETPKEVA